MRLYRKEMEYRTMTADKSILKDNCLEKDSFVNCNETWCRVNKVAKVVIYCYEDVPRRRDALRHILVKIGH